VSGAREAAGPDGSGLARPGWKLGSPHAELCYLVAGEPSVPSGRPTVGRPPIASLCGQVFRTHPPVPPTEGLAAFLLLRKSGAPRTAVRSADLNPLSFKPHVVPDPTPAIEAERPARSGRRTLCFGGRDGATPHRISEFRPMCARKLQARRLRTGCDASRILDEDGRAGRGVEPRKGCWMLVVEASAMELTTANPLIPALCSRRLALLRRCPNRQSELRERHRCARAPGIYGCVREEWRAT